MKFVSETKCWMLVSMSESEINSLVLSTWEMVEGLSSSSIVSSTWAASAVVSMVTLEGVDLLGGAEEVLLG